MDKSGLLSRAEKNVLKKGHNMIDHKLKNL